MHTATVTMTNSPSNRWFLRQFEQLLQRHRYAQASTLLAQQVELFCQQVDQVQARKFLLQFPCFPAVDNPALLYIEGILHLCAGNAAAATARLGLAHQLYSEAAAYLDAMQATLALVKVALTSHDVDAAYNYLEKSQPLLQAGHINDFAVVGDFYLHMAQVLMAYRRFADSQTYAQQALAAYTQARGRRGRLEGLLCLALTGVRLGYYSEATSHLRLVHQSLRRNPMLEGQLLYIELHLHLYQRELVQALHLAHRYCKLVDRTADAPACLTARLLLGNLYRELEEFVTATRWYGETSQLLQTHAHYTFQQQLTLEYVWLDIVEGRLADARQRIYACLENVQLEPAMNFQTQLAIIHLLEGDLAGAERLLQESLTFYRQRGDRLACCALHTYLAYIALQHHHAQAILYHVEQSFGWMSRHKIESFPQWWHPDLLAAVCSQTLAANLYSELSERILVNYLGNHGINALTHFLQYDDIEARRRAYRLLHIISGTTANLLAHLPEGPGKTVLMMLLSDGRLRADAYPLLEQELMTANYRRAPNVTILAVFGLYINQVSRTEIAQQLQCSVENARNYITQIYQHFGVAAKDFPTRKARWQRLVEIARAQGFIE